eukprot:scaffold31709_cov118-Isochrysis_galbana.AAC.10
MDGCPVYEPQSSVPSIIPPSRESRARHEAHAWPHPPLGTRALFAAQLRQVPVIMRRAVRHRGVISGAPPIGTRAQPPPLPQQLVRHLGVLILDERHMRGRQPWHRQPVAACPLSEARHAARIYSL